MNLTFERRLLDLMSLLVYRVKSFRVLVRFGLQFEFMFGQYFSSNAEIWKLGVLGFGEGMLLIVLS